MLEAPANEPFIRLLSNAIQAALLLVFFALSPYPAARGHIIYIPGQFAAGV